MSVQRSQIWEPYVLRVRNVLGSIVEAGVLTRYALRQSVCDLKAAQMSLQYSLIRELTFYKLELDHNASNATKSICWAKGDGRVDPSIVTRSQ